MLSVPRRWPPNRVNPVSVMTFRSVKYSWSNPILGTKDSAFSQDCLCRSICRLRRQKFWGWSSGTTNCTVYVTGRQVLLKRFFLLFPFSLVCPRCAKTRTVRSRSPMTTTDFWSSSSSTSLSLSLSLSLTHSRSTRLIFVDISHSNTPIEIEEKIVRRIHGSGIGFIVSIVRI